MLGIYARNGFLVVGYFEAAKSLLFEVDGKLFSSFFFLSRDIPAPPVRISYIHWKAGDRVSAVLCPKAASHTSRQSVLRRFFRPSQPGNGNLKDVNPLMPVVGAFRVVD